MLLVTHDLAVADRLADDLIASKAAESSIVSDSDSMSGPLRNLPRNAV